jgi:hypothetical protein
MGLDTSHNCWHGSYSSFSEWRHHLGTLANIPYKVETLKTPWFKHEYYVPDTKTPSTDPIMILLNHSDCDGVIKVDQLNPLKDRLEELLLLIDPLHDYFIAKTKAFIKGLEEAINQNEEVEFH